MSPHNAAEKHARYMLRRLLGANSNRGRMMLLFHDHKGATKALQILKAATHFLQRKHCCSLLCQVGFTVHDPLRMRLLVQLWPYAGVLHPKPIRNIRAGASSGGSSSSSREDQDRNSSKGAGQQQDGQSSSARDGNDDDIKNQQQNSGSNGPARSSWMAKCLEGSVPAASILPQAVAHLPPLAVPLAVAHSVTLNASRHSDPPQLARLISSALTLKGRCRVNVAGGVAALNALTAVALAELLLMRSSGIGLAMHLQAVSKVEQLPPGSPRPTHTVRYYQLTLLVCKQTGPQGEFVPATCVFRVRGKGDRQPKQQQQQGVWHKQVAEAEDDGEEGYL